MQDRAEINLGAGRGVTVREFPLKTGFADYLLFVDRRPIGAIEAKAEGIALAGVEPQAEQYGAGLPDNLNAWHRPLPFLYESTGVETFFTNGLDPEPRSRRTFAFHQPETLAQWAEKGEVTSPYPSFRDVCRTPRFPIQCGLFVLDEFNPVDQGGPACYDEVYCGLQYLR